MGDPTRTYDWNGHIDMPISGLGLSDVQVAGQVRMLMRHQLNHEFICCLARDRIMALVKEKAQDRERIADLEVRVKALEGTHD